MWVLLLGIIRTKTTKEKEDKKELGVIAEIKEKKKKKNVLFSLSRSIILVILAELILIKTATAIKTNKFKNGDGIKEKHKEKTE